MKLTFTPSAVDALKIRQASKNLSLYYYTDTEFCACAASGIFSLRVNDTTEDYYDANLPTNLGAVRVQKESLIYLDQENVIDFKLDKNAFVLKSERGYLNLNLMLEIFTLHS